MRKKYFSGLIEDMDSFIARDPAAKSRLEVFLCYPGFHAILFYRFAHLLWCNDLHLLGRFISSLGKFFTGIEIHPGAVIGSRLFIDHGNGVVIGETSEIGSDVTLYQGVTLGGTSLESGKRHPTLENGVIVGSGAQVLGPIVVRSGARIGANAVVLSDVPQNATMVGIPAKVLMGRDKKEKNSFTAYGTPTDQLSDPVIQGFETMRSQLNILNERLEKLEGQLEDEKNKNQKKEVKRSGT